MELLTALWIEDFLIGHRQNYQNKTSSRQLEASKSTTFIKNTIKILKKKQLSLERGQSNSTDDNINNNWA